MTAGLLTQPRYRKGAYLASNEVSELRAKVRDLELKVVTQQKLIEILKSLPGRDINIEAENIHASPRKARVSRGAQKACGSEAPDGTARKPKDDGRVSEADATDDAQLESKGAGTEAQTRS